MATVFKRSQNKKDKDAKWMISWYDSENDRWKNAAGYTDKELSLAMGRRLEGESQRRREGFTSGVREEALRPVEDHLQDYLTHIKTSGRAPDYIDQLAKRIRRLLNEAKVTRLVDVTEAVIETTLLAMKKTRGFEVDGELLSVGTRNEYITSITGFTKWASKRRKMEYDPLAGMQKAALNDVDRVHPRRALSMEEVAALLDAALRRPVAELLTVRVGENKGKLIATVRESVLEKAKQAGIDRRMAYLVAIWTGLRREELSQLQWRDVILEVDHPYIQLRADETKSRRGDTLGLHVQAVEELLDYRPAKFLPTDRVLRIVPSMEVMKRDLAFAGIEYGDKELGFADMHAQRKTLNNMLASQNVDVRTRQAQLRHTDPRLTEVTYFDKQKFIKPQAEKLNMAAPIPGLAGAVGRDVDNLPSGAVNAQQTGSTTGHSESPRVTELLPGLDEMFKTLDPKSLVFSPGFGTKRHDPASLDAGSVLKRAKGVEPSTFTLAT
jgi:integrase